MIRGLFLFCVTSAALSACGGGTYVSSGPAPGVPTAAPVAGATATPTPVSTGVPVVMPSTGKGSGSPSNAPTQAPTASPTPLPPGTTPTPAPTAAPTLPATQQFIYVTNHGPFGAGSANQSSVTVYPITASGDATPIATLTGPSTNMKAIQFVAVDSKKNIYVSSEQNGYRSGTITEYTSPYGNVAPTTTLSGLFAPEGLAIDSSDNLYAGMIDGIYEYAPGAGGNDPAPAVKLTGGTGNNEVYNAYETFLDKNGKLYVALQNQVETYNPNPMDNTALDQNIFGEATTLFYVLGVAADSSGNIYATNQSINTITEFSSTANNANGASAAGPNPSGSITGTAFDDPWGIFIDSGDNAYVVNRGNNSILIFTAAAFATGIPTATISGADTGLNNPIGVYVR